jgi:hypothetical protein
LARFPIAVVEEFSGALIVSFVHNQLGPGRSERTGGSDGGDNGGDSERVHVSYSEERWGKWFDH